MERIYQAYPRHVGKAGALKAITRVLDAIVNRGEADPVKWLLERVRLFAASPAGKAGTYTPYPATWFNQGRYDDDPNEWDRDERSNGKTGGRDRSGQFPENLRL